MQLRPLLVPVAAMIAVAGCATVEVKPIHITVDVNIKIDKALDDFYGKPATPVAAPAPATTPAPTTP